jgi:hypothetical protein|tara:strand:+ start:29180 stop:29869 length:690 start_codon:yes stop_codon:yes gene_type:complete
MCIFIPFLLLVIINFPIFASEIEWTEKKLGKAILKADKAARQEKWSRAIRYGEKMLLGSLKLDQKSDTRYINQLKNLNYYYDQANRLPEISARLLEAYLLSTEHLGLSHNTTIVSRQLYYKLLISEKKYPGAIALVLESMSILGKNEEDNFKMHRYLKQLYSLYGLTGQLQQEEKTILEFMKLNIQLFGRNEEDFKKVIVVLAKNYCRQRKLNKFNQLIFYYNLKYSCK